LPTLIAFGGFDPSGQAGLVADAETAHALGCEARLILCARTAQGGGPVRVWPVPDRERRAVLAELTAMPGPLAVKTGAAGRIAHVVAAVRWARKLGAPVVVDPVAATSAGGWLWPRIGPRDWAKELRERVLPSATVLTPNWPELALLAGTGAGDLPAAENVLRSMPCATLLKGGHAPGDLRGTDLVWDGHNLHVLPKWPDWHGNLRGSGCRLASALAIALSRGRNLLEASTEAGRHVNLVARGRA
jgi:hydroxymethylpyrimidine/phosphomethylpyrimidine kinase